jgi:hypothetical protein
MPECWKKVSLASAFLLVVKCLSPISTFWHQGQSGTAGQGLLRHCTAMTISVKLLPKPLSMLPEISNKQNILQSFFHLHGNKECEITSTAFYSFSMPYVFVCMV